MLVWWNFYFTINHDENFLQWKDHEILLKDPNKFFDSNLLTDLNRTLDIFDQEIISNYASCIQDSKYEHF